MLWLPRKSLWLPPHLKFAGSMPLMGVGPTSPSGLPFPSTLENREFWFRASADLYTDAGSAAAGDGDLIHQWNDQWAADVADYTATRNADNRRPTLQTGVVNGQPVVRFDAVVGQEDRMDLGASTSLAAEYELWYVGQFPADADSCFIAGSDNNNLVWRQTSTQLRWRGGAGATTLSFNYPSGFDGSSFYIILINKNSSNQNNVWINGVASATNPQTDAADPTATLDRLGLNSANNRPLTGDMAEMMCYNADNATADKNSIGQFFADLYGLSWTTIT